MQVAHTQRYCCTTPGALCFWFAVFLVFYGFGQMVLQWTPALGGYEDTVLFAAMGLGCVVNAAWNKTFHCFITGPLFLGVAAVLAMEESGMFSVPWSLVWGVTLVGAGFALLLERRFAH